MITKLTAVINKLSDEGLKVKAIILNSYNHVAFYTEINFMFPVTDELIYSREFNYMGVKIQIDTDIFESKKLTDDEFFIVT